MTDTSKATIYLAGERGVEQHSFRSLHTFNFGKFFNEYKIPFRDLYVLNDDILCGGDSMKMKVAECSCIILLPVVGAIDYKDTGGNESLINSGEMQIINLPGSSHFEVTNPYENDLVNYLQFWIRIPPTAITSVPSVFSFDLVGNKNKLVEIKNDTGSTKLSIGQFTGRNEAYYTLKNDSLGLFVFVIEGVFEVQGRLLHQRDGLALWNLKEPVDMEALSNEAIVMLVEL